MPYKDPEDYKAWRARNLEKRKAQARRRYLANIARVREMAKKWKENNLDKCREIERKWRERNREKKREQARAWYASNRRRKEENCRKWRKANIEKCRAMSRKQYWGNKDLFETNEVLREFKKTLGRSHVGNERYSRT